MHKHLQFESHYVNRSNWLRAAVLGANDGILSTSSLVIGVAAATDLRNPIVLAALAGIVAGAFSMAAGEYVSVSSQSDIEAADLAREQQELETMPEAELGELARIYENRGLQPELAMDVARALTEHNALEAHAKDELGINEITQANAFQAALASGASFISGGLLPLLVAMFAPVKNLILFEYVCSIVFLALAGMIAARAGGSGVLKGMIRVCFWGTLAMGAAALVGYLFGVQTS